MDDLDLFENLQAITNLNNLEMAVELGTGNNSSFRREALDPFQRK